MNAEKLKTKRYIKGLPPLKAKQLFDEYGIPSPYKEVLYLVCVERCPSYYEVVRRLSSDYGINMSFWQVGYRLLEGLDKFDSAKKFSESKQTTELIV